MSETAVAVLYTVRNFLREEKENTKKLQLQDDGGGGDGGGRGKVIKSAKLQLLRIVQISY